MKDQTILAGVSVILCTAHRSRTIRVTVFHSRQLGFKARCVVDLCTSGRPASLMFRRTANTAIKHLLESFCSSYRKTGNQSADPEAAIADTTLD